MSMTESAADAAALQTVEGTASEAWGERLTIGFGMAAAMWGVGFLARLPEVELPGAVVFIVLHACLLLGGLLAGSIARAAQAGLITGLINLLILGAVLRNLDGTFNQYALLWVPATLALSAGLAALGRALAGERHRSVDGDPWPMRFGLVTIGATLLLIGVGGSVTGYEAGLAVPDWPNSFRYNMFLFPLAKMTGGIYFEHAHRLLGTLVGLTTLVFMIYVAGFREQRTWLRVAIVIAFVLVCVQGLLGGLRVTGRLTTSMDAADLAPNTTYAMIHGTLAQVFFSLLVLVTCALSRTWQRSPQIAGGWSRNGVLAILLVLVQILLGAILRHGEATWALHLHYTLALFVAIVVGLLAIRSWGQEQQRPVASLGLALLWTLGAQLLLGFMALAAIMIDTSEDGPHSLQVIVTTLHQTMGAILLGACVGVVAWRHRLGVDRPGPVVETDAMASQA